jgi:hypothetical protein
MLIINNHQKVIMIDKTKIMQRLKRINGPIKAHIRECEEYTGVPGYRDSYVTALEIDKEYLKETPFSSLKEALKKDRLYLCHNGDISIGLPFEEVVSILGLHDSPKGIPVYAHDKNDPFLTAGIFNIIVEPNYEFYPLHDISTHRIPRLKSRVIDFPNNVNEHVYVEDTNPKIGYPSITHKIVEYLFGMEEHTFLTRITQGGRGFRIDRHGPVAELMEKLLEDDVPLFIDKADPHENGISKEQFYVIGGMKA